jgi:hypothetical protein
MMGGDKGTGKGTASATLVFPNGFEGCSNPVGVTDVSQNPALPLGFFVGGMGGNSQWELGKDGRNGNDGIGGEVC